MNKILFFLCGLLLFTSCTTSSPDDFHIHADFKVYIENEFLNFSQEQYMSAESPLHDYIHLHDMNGDVIHFHHEDVTILDFFNSLEMNLTNSCFSNDNGQDYCTNSTHTLKILVNGEQIDDVLPYIAQDLDRILIIYSNKTDKEISELFTQVTDIACIQSEVCPERGEPSDESTCTGSSCVYVLE